MIKWIKTSDVEPDLVQDRVEWEQYVFLGYNCEGSHFPNNDERGSICDIFPMIRDAEGYKYAVSPHFPLTTTPQYWTKDISLPGAI